MVKLAEHNLRSTNQSITHTRCYVSGLRLGMKARNSIYKSLYMMLKEGLNESKLAHNVLHKTSKGMREMNYQDIQQFERATMLNNLLKPLLVLCGVMGSRSLKYSLGRAL